MIAFFQDMAINPLLLTGLLAGVLAAIACGLIGPFVITRRIAFLAGAVAHMAVGGIGVAIYLRYHLPGLFGWLDPFYGAVAAAVAGALSVGIAHHRAYDRIDTLIGAMWAIGMAVGILLVKYTPGYQVELMSYLFGNIAVVEWVDVLRLLVIDLVVLGVGAVWYKRLVAVSLDEEYADLQGVNPLKANLLLLVLVALTVVSLMQVVGLILVLALLTLPAATAGHYARRLGTMMLLATLIALLVATLPRMAVYGTGISPESAIVLAAGLVYLLSVFWQELRRALRH
jgi:zinc transport system permease protein